MDMPKQTAYLGVGLIVLGVAGYFASGQASPTALIPAAFGVAFLLLGVAATRASSSKHLMHAATVLALVGLIGTAGGVLDLVSLLTGDDVERPLAAWSRSLMAIAMVVFLAHCARSFREARKARQ